MVEEEGAGAPERSSRVGSGDRGVRRERIFTDPPRMLDRFELVLLFVLATIAVQGLVDVRGSVVAELFTHAITGLALIAAVRASAHVAGGVARPTCS